MQTYTQGVSLCEDGGRNWSDAAISQGAPGIAGNQAARSQEEARKDSSPLESLIS